MDKNDKVTELSLSTIHAVTGAAGEIDAMVARLNNLKAAANYVRYRLHETGSIAVLDTAIEVTDSNTKAVGLKYAGIEDVFYSPEMAARYLKVKGGVIDSAVTAGAVYWVQITGVLLIPQKALDIFSVQSLKPQS